MKYIIKNCPATQYYTCEKYGIYQDCPDCIIKQIVGLCKENQFYGYGAIMLENGLSTDILNLLEIEKVNE